MCFTYAVGQQLHALLSSVQRRGQYASIGLELICRLRASNIHYITTTATTTIIIIIIIIIITIIIIIIIILT